MTDSLLDGVRRIDTHVTAEVMWRYPGPEMVVHFREVQPNGEIKHLHVEMQKVLQAAFEALKDESPTN